MRHLILLPALLLGPLPFAAAAEAPAAYVTAVGRSPIPQPDESITQPIPAVRLQPEHLPEPPATPVPWNEAATYVGQWLTVEGVVIDTGNIGHLAFLNFSRERGPDDFYIAMFQEAFEGLPDAPERYYLGKTVRVTGPVTRYRGRAQVEVRDRKQIEVVQSEERVPQATSGEKAAAGTVIPWREAKHHVGQRVTAEGTVVSTRNLGHLCFLNFVEDWEGQFYVAMFEEAFAGLPQPPQTYYQGRTIRVTGEVTMHKGRPQIQVRQADQVEVVGRKPARETDK